MYINITHFLLNPQPAAFSIGMRFIFLSVSEIFISVICQSVKEKSSADQLTPVNSIKVFCWTFHSTFGSMLQSMNCTVGGGSESLALC